jgi:hypothetical protein
MISCKVVVIGLSAAQAIRRRVAEFFCVSSGVYAMPVSFLHQSGQLAPVLGRQADPLVMRHYF